MKNGLDHRLLAQRPAPIGIFDSGVGGLTVLREIYRQLPNESVLYFGDTARLPYGSRSPEEILYFVRQILTWMADQGVKMVIMACNTSSALALDLVQGEFPFPVLGLIRPGAQAAALRGRRIGVIATQATVTSRAYTHAIQEINPDCRVWEVGCPLFVPIVEQNQIKDPHAQRTAATYLQPLMAANIDTLVYGCTHYPHLAPVLRPILPAAMQYVDPAISMVAAAAKELDALGLRSSTPAWSTEFYVSGSAPEFKRLAVQWLGHQPAVRQIRLPELVAHPKG
ncbi:glutamate racemase [Leptolyngbya sp. CCNP1308]|uniref:glutamate racemase n=1 Tax=Leptolyngbya sp. CCNP1308 TaxID=3110255 RepID=UPI002B2165AE|nr:glutamate racemase [Leptolyngbya sp. CCNP1308]MEA5451026.1 glutamate racemase [Leptolyngbya sp. CCNP1308]